MFYLINALTKIGVRVPVEPSETILYHLKYDSSTGRCCWTKLLQVGFAKVGQLASFAVQIFLLMP